MERRESVYHARKGGEVMAIKLREYQTDLINRVKTAIMQGNKSVCVVLGCGG